MCPCKGDRTARHKILRDLVYTDCKEVAFRPERKKAGLEPSRPSEDGLAVGNSNARRPADIWLPRGLDGRGEALDFACSSALRSDSVALAATDPSAIFQEYEKLEREFKDTDRLCSEAGFTCTPMVCESHSGHGVRAHAKCSLG